MRRRTYIFILSFVAGLFLPFCVLADSNNISSLVFTTNPQTVSVNTSSQTITVQTENSAGTAEKVSETNDVTFTSTSATGQFLNSSGGAVSTTMSTNTSSRTFYYEDSTAGTYTLTVNIKGRTSGKQFSATQTIVITSSSQNSSSSDSSGASSTETSTTNSNNSSGNSNDDSLDAYSSQETTYSGSDNESFNLSIGRNRLVSVGEPVVFDARIISSDTSYGGTLFHWAFGDGTEWNGTTATHTYEYPGDYIVVVEASRFSDAAVAETRVKVIVPNVTISSAANDSMIITNKGDDEINLGGWTVEDDLGRFIMPQDTIISSNSSVTISGKVMKSQQFSGDIVLYDPSAKEIASVSSGPSRISGDMAVALPDGMSVEDFTEKLSSAVGISTTGNIVAETKAKARPAGGQAAPLLANTEASTASSSISLASSRASSSAAAVIYTIPRQSPEFFSRIVSWFGGLFRKK